MACGKKCMRRKLRRLFKKKKSYMRMSRRSTNNLGNGKLRNSKRNKKLLMYKYWKN